VQIEVHGWIVQCSGHPNMKARPLPAAFLQFVLEERWGMDKCKLGVISQGPLKIEFKLLFSADRKVIYATSISTTTDYF